MADIVYNNFKEQVMEAVFNLLEGQDDVRVALYDNTFTEDQDNDVDMADLTGELSGTGYAHPGGALANQTVTQDDTDNEGVFDADDLTFTALDAGTIDTLVYLVNAGSPPINLLIGSVDSATGLPLTSNGGDVTIAFAAEGILNIT